MLINPFRREIQILLLVGLLISGCSLFPSNTPPPDLTATVAALTPTDRPVTPTPLPPLAVLVVPDGADPTLAEQLEQKMRTLTEAAEMRFQVRPSLSQNELSDDMTVVAVLAPDPGLSALASATLQTQFIGVGIEGLAAGNNLSLIHAQAYDAQDLAFIAGFIAGVITPDWRAGILLPSDQTDAALLQQAYSNGLHYWCGLCQPAYAPFVVYPQFAQILNSTDPVAALTPVDSLVNAGVTTIYIPDGVMSTELSEYIAQKQIMMIGTVEPPESTASLWVVSLQAGSLLGVFDSVWLEIMAGRGGRDAIVPLALSNTEAGLLGEPRQRVVTEMLTELMSGLIDPGSVPDL
jgi:hypothetical protein